VQNIAEIPQNIKDIYKTTWEIKQKALIDMSADRGAFICQSQSLNVFMQDANFGKMSSMHFYAWKKGLKTGMYYLRTKAAVDAIKFTVEKQAEPQLQPIISGGKSEQNIKDMACSLDNPDACEACSA
jgi:ribonucleoside-diphosphate reductase alpha chain